MSEQNQTGQQNNQQADQDTSHKGTPDLEEVDSQTKCKCQSNTGICIEVDEWLPTTST